jgi:hypothetical protein
LYVAYADKGTAGDKADVFFASSTDAGATWPTPTRITTVSANDQRMPVLAVKPDGTQLFTAWYDRRRDPNNSLIDVYARWATISTGGTVTFGSEFRVTSTSFPPVFAGTLLENKNQSHYDPAYAPENVNLHWWYPDWPEDVLEVTEGPHRSHVGEYNGASGDSSCVYITWTDNRMRSPSKYFGRNQSDIRLLRLPWPL